MTRTGRPCSSGETSRRNSPPSSDPSSRHATAALRCCEAVAARRRCTSRVVVRSWPAARKAAIFAGPAAWNDEAQASKTSRRRSVRPPWVCEAPRRERRISASFSSRFTVRWRSFFGGFKVTRSVRDRAIAIYKTEIAPLNLKFANLRRIQHGRKSESSNRRIEQLELRLEELESRDEQITCALTDKPAPRAAAASKPGLSETRVAPSLDRWW